jgi:hypothetical protein
VASAWIYLLPVASVVGAAVGSFFVTRGSRSSEYTHDMADIVQTYEIDNRRLREELVRKDAHIAQLLAENEYWRQQVVKERNGKKKDHGDHSEHS